MHARRWDIFCTVVDNFGDIGVCWRLSQQLSGQHGLAVRLWVDDLSAFRQIEPGVALDCASQTIKGISVCHWTAAEVARAAPAEVVIEAFACELPDSYLQAMTHCEPAPVWINLEYLSAENWVEGCHGLPSKHPGLGLVKHFFFPGFTNRTGGILKEPGIDARRQRFQSNPVTQQDFWLNCQAPLPKADEMRVSLFCYENPALTALLDTWAGGSQPIYCAVPVGKPLAAIAAWSNNDALAPGHLIERGSLRLAILPFLDQTSYDHLLWACDLNFVRGEDSFVRAHWAQRPFVWHIYPQQENVHRLKLDAFLQRYARAPEGASIRRFWYAWNGQDDETDNIPLTWLDFFTSLPQQRLHIRNWAEEIAQNGELSDKLVHFCAELLK